ncbi:bifunctional 2-polyprenyl-6-hydroxyphenol methylase/3-demethylubiquinol 3-O-methyltransferase UbiG [Oscillatoria sp. CS-180]|uniref:bifunctional 2-polyprenyl-6-hydroxyphenol methylase/3-demethylubiquinol 3-O-methyltransferase UbiG n=1 Tax=Oscillatoria sp. CS-180 TaxID=3021720 RepID=UPI00232ABE74|nr:bifunctional 2-polyprenyl-6-hydroxyphenol methylase/3-demethylubiquinol 3-O-methyltransferase UbiG [Oscillatoria sp. CS-180]MDB9529148.1 bifunctional 2-polyprenyl-6-hydroxyphenol methylase/3-demethylubiquinol 3-O-methyltransferase UbiG [Oscillatoria sp. CS-180]
MQRNNLAFYDQQAADWWNENATIFPLSKLNPLRFQYFDRHISSWSGLKVLDVGCGGGYTCEFLARQGAIVTGIDQSAACIEAAKIHAQVMGFEIAYYAGMAEEMPFAANQFDVVICVDVLEHVQNPAATIAEIGRVLKPGGLFCFDTINRTWQSRWLMIWLLEDLLRKIPRGLHDWHKFLPPEELKGLLEKNDFLDVKIHGFDLLGRHAIAQLTTLLHYWQTGDFRVRFDEDTTVIYIGTAQKDQKP